VETGDEEDGEATPPQGDPLRAALLSSLVAHPGQVALTASNAAMGRVAPQAGSTALQGRPTAQASSSGASPESGRRSANSTPAPAVNAAPLEISAVGGTVSGSGASAPGPDGKRPIDLGTGAVTGDDADVDNDDDGQTSGVSGDGTSASRVRDDSECASNASGSNGDGRRDSDGGAVDGRGIHEPAESTKGSPWSNVPAARDEGARSSRADSEDGASMRTSDGEEGADVNASGGMEASGGAEDDDDDDVDGSPLGLRAALRGDPARAAGVEMIRVSVFVGGEGHHNSKAS